MYLLDTNVVSEAISVRPSPRVQRWLDDADEDQLFLSVVTIAEIRFGIRRMNDGSRKRRLDVWLTNELPARFERRIFPVDAAIADVAGIIGAERSLKGHRMEAMDALIAATAAVHGLTVVTRDVKDFTGSVPRIVNPWDEA
jgi:predicted nucleic acid-binding protein